MSSLDLALLFTVCAFHAFIGLIVFIKNSKQQLNRVFGALTLSVIIWTLANYFSSFASVPYDLALPLNFLTLVAAAFAIYFFALFSIYLAGNGQKPARLWIWTLTFVALASAVLSATPFVISGIEVEGNFWVISFGSLGVVYFIYIIAYFCLMIGSLIAGYRRTKGIDRQRILYVLFSLLLSIGAAVITNLVAPFISRDFSLVPYGPFSTIFMIAGFSYVMVRHRLFNIRLIVARSVAYILLLSSLATLYTAGVFTLSELFFPENSTTATETFLHILLALLVAFTFQPLRRFFERITDKVFYRDHYDAQAVVNRITQIAASQIHLEKLLDESLAELCQSLKVLRGLFMIFNKGKIYKVAHFGPLPDRIIVVPELRKLNRTVLVADELPPGERKEIMDHHSIRLSLALRTKEEFVGFLLLGDKLSGDVYTNQDIELLRILATELAVAISNSKGYEEIARFNVTLQEKISRATSKLRVANRNLKALDHTKDEFISLTSHQLRTPLTTVKGYLSMIAEGDAGEVTPAQRQFLNFALEGTQRMVSLISDLLNVSRMSAGRFMLDKQPVDLTKVLADETRQLQSRAAAKQLQLTFTPPAKKLPLVELDEAKTRQVIMNFIDNAIYYTPAGKVEVTIDWVGDALQVRVTDTGIGVPKLEQSKLFAKFYRAHNAQTIRPDGTGLGLYMAKRVIEDQGGKIIFESVVNHGSTFGFEMPLPVARPSGRRTRRPASSVKVAV